MKRFGASGIVDLEVVEISSECNVAEAKTDLFSAVVPWIAISSLLRFSDVEVTEVMMAWRGNSGCDLARPETNNVALGSFSSLVYNCASLSCTIELDR